MLDDHQYFHLKLLLEGLGEVTNKLDSVPKKFVEDMNERFEKYDKNINISAKQLAWLERLYKEHVGPLDE